MNARVKSELFTLLEQQSDSDGGKGRWLGAFLFVVAVHGSVAAILLHNSPPPATDLGTGTPMVVEIADFVSAPRAAVAEAADTAEPIPTKIEQDGPEAMAEADETPPPPLEPEPAPEEPRPIVEAKPLATPPVAKAKPPVPEKQPEVQPDNPPSASASPTRSRHPAARTAAQAAQQSESQLASLQESWQGAVNAHLEGYKRYPHTARSRSQKGIARLRFQLDRRGRVTESELTQSSGHFLLDREAQAVLKRAQPLPPPPQDIPGERLDLVWQVEFELR